MLVLNRLLLNMEYVVINALNALASIVSMCDLHAIFLSNITKKYRLPPVFIDPNVALLRPLRH
jgi:hypothetical protein